MNKKIWDLYAPIYKIAMLPDEKTYKLMYHRIPKVIQNKTVLEIATGPGLLAKKVAYSAKKMIATDYSEGMIEEAKKGTVPSNLSFEVADATALPYKDQSFDVVIIANALHIMPDPEKALQEISELVKSDDAFIGYGTLHQGNTNSAEILRNSKKNGLLGLKLHSDFQQFNIDDPDMYPVYAEAEKQGIPILFHMGDYSHWNEALDVLQPSERLYFDFSSTLQFIDGDMLRKFLDKFGEEQFFFGSDFPMWDPAEELKRLVSFGLLPQTLRLLLSDNFSRFIATIQRV